MIETIDEKNFSHVLPLIRAYQQFYSVEDIDDERNRKFFSQFLLDHSRGVMHLYREKNKAVGFTTLYFNFSSTRAETVAVLNDLFVLPEYRGLGIGKALLCNAEQVARSLGYSRMQWLTAENNHGAQKLYDVSDANKSAWFFYAKQL